MKGGTSIEKNSSISSAKRKKLDFRTGMEMCGSKEILIDSCGDKLIVGYQKRFFLFQTSTRWLQ